MTFQTMIMDLESFVEMFDGLTAVFVYLAGVVLGFATGLAFCIVFIEKIICRRCIRTIVAFGFHSDGKEYVAVAKDKAEEIERS